LLDNIQLLGIGTLVAAVAAPFAIPALSGAAGFGALGPVVGGLRAAWQANLGLVQVGSIVVWCQSVAMGGASVTGMTTTLARAGGGLAAAVASAMKDDSELINPVRSWRKTMERAKEIVDATN
jgi:hypothetical protein